MSLEIYEIDLAVLGCNIGTAVVGTDIYMFGGYLFTINSYKTGTSTIRIYHTATNELEQVITGVSLLAGAYKACCRLGTKIYIFAGREMYKNGNNQWDSSMSSIQVFDITTKNLETLSTPASPYIVGDYGRAAVIARDATIYAAASTVTSGKRSSKLVVYNPATNTTSTGGVFSSKDAYRTLCEFEGKIILLEGTMVSEVIVESPLAENNIQIQNDTITNLFPIIQNNNLQLQTGIKQVFKGNQNNIAELCDAYIHNGTNWINVNTGEAYA